MVSNCQVDAGALTTDAFCYKDLAPHMVGFAYEEEQGILKIQAMKTPR
jgi:hypothetical protein